MYGMRAKNCGIGLSMRPRNRANVGRAVYNMHTHRSLQLVRSSDRSHDVSRFLGQTDRQTPCYIAVASSGPLTPPENWETSTTPDSGVSSISGSLCSSAAIKSRSSSSPTSTNRDCNASTSAFQYCGTFHRGISSGYSTSSINPACISERVRPCAAATSSQLRGLTLHS